jgi:hypothetical protein
MQLGGEKMRKIFITILMLTSLAVAGGKVLYSVDFTKQQDGDAKGWLRSQGFKLLLDADKLSMKFSGGKLVIQTSGEYAGMFGIQLPEGKYLQNIGSVTIEWGVDKFPAGANWAGGNNRLAIGALLALGTEKLSSGLPMGVNAAPYFLGPFIGQKEQPGKMYLGALYKQGGRYYCVSNKNGGSTVTTQFNIDQKFQQAFKKPTPPLTAFGFQMNTKDTKGGAQAFIKRIIFRSK